MSKRIRKYEHNPDGSIRRKLTRQEIYEQRVEQQRAEHLAKLEEEARKKAKATDIPHRRPHEPRDMSPPPDPPTLTVGEQTSFHGVAVQVGDEPLVLDDGQDVVYVKGLPDDMEFKLGFGYEARGEVVDTNVVQADEIVTDDDPLRHTNQ